MKSWAVALLVVAVVVVLALLGLSIYAYKLLYYPPGDETQISDVLFSGVQPFATGFDTAIGMVQRTPRYNYVWEQGGKVWRLNTDSGERTLVFDISAMLFNEIGLNTFAEERGLLGLAFHPMRVNEVFVAYSSPASDMQRDEFDHIARLSRFTVRNSGASDEQFVDETVILDIPQNTVVHHGQSVLFGPNDGLLYYSTGDSGPQKDPNRNAQNPFDLRGKILRIDVDGATAPSSQRNYAIPPQNPFADGQRGAPEVIALGLRNPWRFSFDAAGERIFIGDVGHNEQEALKILDLPAMQASEQPVNFGWAVYEGNKKTGYDDGAGLSIEPLTPPAFVYDTGGALGRAIVGGYPLDGSGIPTDASAALPESRYLFADYLSGKLVVIEEGRRNDEQSDNAMLQWHVVAEAKPDQWMPASSSPNGANPLLPQQPTSTDSLFSARKTVPALARDAVGNLYAFTRSLIGSMRDTDGRTEIYRLGHHLRAAATTPAGEQKVK